jgi:hypothetical protein
MPFALSSGPATWMDEGYAQCHQYTPNEWLSQIVEDAGSRGDLIPLRLATGCFNGDDERIRLLCAKS